MQTPTVPPPGAWSVDPEEDQPDTGSGTTKGVGDRTGKEEPPPEEG